MPKSANLTNRQSSVYSESKVVCYLPKGDVCELFIGFVWHNPSRTSTSPCRVLLGFILLKDNAYPSTPPSLLKPSEMVFTMAELQHDRNKTGYAEPQSRPNYP
ncbi:unnamed protein product [Camellia sinensis]